MERKENKKNKKKSLFVGLILVFVIIGSISFFGINYYKDAVSAVDLDDPNEVDIVIPSSTSTEKIAEILKDNGLIKNPLVFRYVARKDGVSSKLKAGEYRLSTKMNVRSILDRLVKGSKNIDTTRFTIPEGYEIKQIADKLSEEGLVDKAVFLSLSNDKGNFEEEYSFLKELEKGQSLEGFLFPSTYEVYKDASEKEIIEKMLDVFETVYEEEIKDRVDDFDLDLNQIITLASIIEREGKLDRERPIMSAVFHNRLEDGMKLQSCATVQYILGERKEVLTNADTSIDSPFNTYINTGLPPAPIASSGRASLVAAVNPADVDYLFFVLTGSDGSHTFTRTYEEHLEAKP